MSENELERRIEKLEENQMELYEQIERISDILYDLLKVQSMREYRSILEDGRLEEAREERPEELEALEEMLEGMLND